MELAELIKDKENHIRSPWEFGRLTDYFTRPTELVKLLEPLIVALRWPGEYQQLIEQLPHFSEDLNLTEFLNIMAALGYNNERIPARINNIDPQLFPCLFLPYNSTAPVVILGYKNKEVLVVCGSDGQEKLLKKRWQKGVVIHFSQFKINALEEQQQRESFKNNLYRFKHLGFQMLVLSLVHNLLVASLPLYIMMVYDKVIPSESVTMLLSFMFGIVILTISAYAVQYYRTKILAYIGARLDKTIGASIISHILYLSPIFTENNTVGNQVSRIRDFESIRNFFTSPIAIMICELPFTVLFIAIIAYLGGWLAMVPVSLGAIFFFLYYIANPILVKKIKQHSHQRIAQQTFLLETFSHLREIKMTGRMHIWSNKYKDMMIDYARISFTQTFATTVLTIVSDLLMMFAGLVMLVAGALIAIKSNLSFGVLIAIMMLTWKILNPLKSFFSALPKIDQISNSINQVNKLFAIKTERTNSKILVPDDTYKAKVEFVRVTYKYKPDLPAAILGASFIANPGEIICITGKNSSGKSTLLRLILGMYHPQAGTININGKNILQFDPIEFRSAIAYLPQNIDLFHGTLQQNILFGNMIVDSGSIELATRLADIYDDIMALPDKFATRIGEHSENNFSASFIQRLGLARTYLRRSSIMLFDEPSNNLDYGSDQKFMKAVRYLKHESTIFIVTHRPSHLKMADKIIYLQDGQIALFGPAQSVLQRMPHNY